MANMRCLFLVAACISASAFSANPLQECSKRVAENPSYAPIARKLSLLGAKEQTFMMLANTEYVTESEKPLIADWATAKKQCIDDNQAWLRSNMPPTLLAITNRNISDVLAVAADLYAGKITYGEFAKRREELSNSFEISFTKEQQRMRELQNAGAAQDEAERRRAAAAILSNQRPYQAPQIQPYRPPTPTTTNCATLGSQVTCTTY